jgi:predicted enzyme related to lactoylglutathione lyase
MTPLRSSPVVHLELHTGDLPQARALYAQLCGWHPEWIQTRAGSYLSQLLSTRRRPGYRADAE